MNNTSLKRLTAFIIVLFVLANLICLASLPHLKGAINNSFTELALQTSQLELDSVKMDGKDKHLLGTLEREILQQTIDFSHVQTWFPLFAVLDLKLLQNRITLTSFVATYLTNKYKLS